MAFYKGVDLINGTNELTSKMESFHSFHFSRFFAFCDFETFLYIMQSLFGWRVMEYKTKILLINATLNNFFMINSLQIQIKLVKIMALKPDYRYLQI